MTKSIRSISFIGYSLSLLYGISFLIYLAAYRYSSLSHHTLIILLLFISLFIGSLGVVWLKEWGRRVIVIFNAIMCFYFIFLFFKYPTFIQPTYLLMNFVVILYFSQESTKFQFITNWQFDRKSILVVDDDEGIQKTIKRLFLPNGYSVLTASTGEQGLQIAKLQKPDLILLDVILPGIKGREVCAKLKNDEETKEIPVIFLTAKDSPDDIKAEKEAGANAHLTKPVNAKLLLTEVRKIMSRNLG